MISILSTAGMLILFIIAVVCLVETFRMLRAKNFERTQRAALRYFSLLVCASLCMTAACVISPDKSLRVVGMAFSALALSIIVLMYYVNKKLESKAAQADQITKTQQEWKEDQ